MLIIYLLFIYQYLLDIGIACLILIKLEI